MRPLARRFLLAAVAAGVVGMSLGIAMGISQDFRLRHVHAHVNLLGWVSLALYGLFYQVVPAASAGLLPRVHFWLATLGPVLMCGALADQSEDHGGLVPIIGIGALMTLGGMLCFAAAVTGLRRASTRALQAAS
ncbi:cytochrome-c oxidase [Roseomonas sp. CCTCC AB2023176]|uniref:cytochrome-c oxidase n=1 Tax=Roseomonas sp. CCTCC AB2023176 TaxID=3342640 RepID=UPI0035D67B8C